MQGITFWHGQTEMCLGISFLDLANLNYWGQVTVVRQCREWCD